MRLLIALVFSAAVLVAAPQRIISAAPAVTEFNMNSVSSPVAPAKPGNPAPTAPAPAAADKKAATTGGQITQAQLVSKFGGKPDCLGRATPCLMLLRAVPVVSTEVDDVKPRIISGA